MIPEPETPDARTLILTVGLPYSGKTTWARTQGLPIMCPDAIRLALHGERFLARAEPLVWTLATVMVRALFLAGHPTVILDATNTTVKRRAAWQTGEWRVVYQVFDTAEAECLRRAGVHGDFAILPVIQRMAAQYEPVTVTEQAAFSTAAG